MLVKPTKHFIEQSWLLIVSAFLFGLLIAVANAAWAPRIEQNKIDKLNRLMKGMLTEAKTFELIAEDVVIKLAKGKKAKSNIYKAFSETGQCIGWAFNCQGSGFADKIELVVTLDADAKNLAGYDVLTSNETPGFGDQIKFDYYRAQFRGAPADKIELLKAGNAEKIDDQIIAITGATVSSEAVITIINNYVSQIKEQLITRKLITNEN